MWFAGYSAGLPHSTVFTTAGEFHRSPTVRELRRVLLDGLRQRQTITETLRHHQHLLEPLEFAMLQMGEESGKLEETLEMLGEHFNAEHRAMLEVKRKLAYPMASAIAAIFIAPLPIIFFGNALLYLAIVASETLVALSIGGAVLAAAANRYRSKPKVVLARFCRTLALTVEAGLGLDRVAEFAVLAADNAELTEYWNRLPRDRKSGQSLAAMFASSRIIPRTVTAALEIADVSGDYNGTVRKLAELYTGDIAPR